MKPPFQNFWKGGLFARGCHVVGFLFVMISLWDNYK